MLFTLQKNLMRVHLWGAFAKPLAPRGSSGMMWAVNQNKCRHLIGRRYRPTPAMRCTLNGNTVFWQYFYLKKEPRHRCSTTVQPCTEIFFLHVYKSWLTSPCERRSYSYSMLIVEFSARVSSKFERWPRKTLGHLFHTTSSFVHHFKAIGAFKL